ncbi:MAG: 50S ribosomal protein L35 [Desulfovibrio sp.]|nr:50S ribosomal protein L35 [Desulfovibrio sp.]MBI4961449.1 50S ribosomal protein L35 [Desulfovibrio sp.]
MPKMKTNKSAAKRFTTTGTGKFRRRQQNKRHILTKKSAKRKRALSSSLIVDSANEGAVSRLLPYA